MRLTKKKIIGIINSIIDNIMLLIFLSIFVFGCYALWDSHQVLNEASSTQYTVYKPTPEDNRSFEEFQNINPEVFGWLNIYGTHIDYPVVQADNNEKYLNTSADGEYSLSGSIYLDYRNDKHLKDFNSIFYGHHMEGNALFGEIGSFKDKNYFDTRQYGTLYVDNKTYGLDFFAFLEVDAYDTSIYDISIHDKQSYLDLLKNNAMYYRDIGVNTQDHIILLSTCTSDMTNGRHILVARLSDTVQENTFIDEDDTKNIDFNSSYTWYIIPIIILIIVIISLYKRMQRKEEL